MVCSRCNSIDIVGNNKFETIFLSFYIKATHWIWKNVKRGKRDQHLKNKEISIDSIDCFLKGSQR